MLGIVCQVCSKRPATSHLTELTAAGERRELHICATCIQELQLDLNTHPPLLAEILAKKVEAAMAAGTDSQPAPSIAPDEDADDPACPLCGLLFSQFSANNRFGCARCYDAFKDRVEHLLTRYHGTAIHTGRLPEALPTGAIDRLARRGRLHQALQQAITSEDFEQAAHLRDAIRKLDEAIT